MSPMLASEDLRQGLGYTSSGSGLYNVAELPMTYQDGGDPVPYNHNALMTTCSVDQQGAVKPDLAGQSSLCTAKPPAQTTELCRDQRPVPYTASETPGSQKLDSTREDPPFKCSLNTCGQTFETKRSLR